MFQTSGFAFKHPVTEFLSFPTFFQDAFDEAEKGEELHIEENPIELRATPITLYGTFFIIKLFSYHNTHRCKTLLLLIITQTLNPLVLSLALADNFLSLSIEQFDNFDEKKKI